ncbi:MAG: class I SAM-dependent methyltransferase [Albidovulum sp.]
MLNKSALNLITAYDRIATRWQFGLERLGYPRAYQHLFRCMPEMQATSTLDIGCGTGAFSEALLDAGHNRPDRLTLLDLSVPMLCVAKSRLQGRVPDLAVCNLPIGAELGCRFDLILAAHVFEHLDDPAAALQWACRHLTPGGRIVLAISKPHWCTALIRLRWKNRAMRPAYVLNLLTTAGFKIAHHIPFVQGPPARTSAGYYAIAPL